MLSPSPAAFASRTAWQGDKATGTSLFPRDGAAVSPPTSPECRDFEDPLAPTKPELPTAKIEKMEQLPPAQLSSASPRREWSPQLATNLTEAVFDGMSAGAPEVESVSSLVEQPSVSVLQAAFEEAREHQAPTSLLISLSTRATEARRVEQRNKAELWALELVQDLAVANSLPDVPTEVCVNELVEQSTSSFVDATMSFPNPQTSVEIALELLKCEEAIAEAQWVHDFGDVMRADLDRLFLERQNEFQRESAALTLQDAYRAGSFSSQASCCPRLQLDEDQLAFLSGITEVYPTEVDAAAATVQASWLGHKQRRAFSRAHVAAAQVQALWKGKQLRRALTAELKVLTQLADPRTRFVLANPGVGAAVVLSCLGVAVLAVSVALLRHTSAMDTPPSFLSMASER